MDRWSKCQLPNSKDLSATIVTTIVAIEGAKVGAHITPMDDWLSETNVEGSLFDTEEMERLVAKMQAQPLWVWSEERQPYVMVMGPQIEIAAPIAEGGREIIEQAKEEAFFAWGL